MNVLNNSASAYANIYTEEEVTALLMRLGVEEVCPKGTYLYRLAALLFAKVLPGVRCCGEAG